MIIRTIIILLLLKCVCICEDASQMQLLSVTYCNPLTNLQINETTTFSIAKNIVIVNRFIRDTKQQKIITIEQYSKIMSDIKDIGVTTRSDETNIYDQTDTTIELYDGARVICKYLNSRTPNNMAALQEYNNIFK